MIACGFARAAELCWGPLRREMGSWVCEGHAPKLALGGVYRERPKRAIRVATCPACEFFSGAEPCWGSLAIFDVRPHPADGVLTERYLCEGHAAAPGRGAYVPPPSVHRPLDPTDAAWPF